MTFTQNIVTSCLIVASLNAYGMDPEFAQQKLFEVCEGLWQEQAVKNGWGEPALIRALVSQGAAVSKPKGTDSPLHLAARTNRWGVVAMLLELGAYPRATDYFGQTPLHVATRFGSDRIMGILVNNDRELVTIADGQGDTALHELVKSGHPLEAKKASAALLIGYGADIYQRNIHGKRPVDSQSEELSQYMIECAQRNSSL